MEPIGRALWQGVPPYKRRERVDKIRITIVLSFVIYNDIIIIIK